MTDRYVIFIMIVVLAGLLLYVCWQEPEKSVDKAKQLEFDETNRRAGRAMLLDDLELAQKERQGQLK